MTDQLIFDDLAFEIRESTRRSTLEIIVDRDGSLVLATPPNISEEKKLSFINEKLIWIYTKLEEKKQYSQPQIKKEYVQGEGFYYLGKHYRLRLVDEQEVPLRLYRGRFTLRRKDTDLARTHFIKWYTDHLGTVLDRHIETFLPRIQHRMEKVHIQDLGFKWGTTDRRGHLYFHWRVALLPHRMIDYVVAHELVHLSEPNHSDAFWKKLERLIPDYPDRKLWLAEMGAKYDL